jgi:hypothetical protein
MMRALRGHALGCLVLTACAPADDIVARPRAAQDAGKEDAGVRAIADASEPAADAGTAPFMDAGLPAECCDAGPGADLVEGGVPGLHACGSDTFLLLTKAPFLYRVFAEDGKLDPRGAPPCLPPGDFAAAVDSDGKLWAMPGDGAARVIDPDSLDCTQVVLNLRPQSIAFVYYPDSAEQRLYVLEQGVLLRVDTATLTSTPLGKLEPSRLAGTADGRLFAISDRSGGAIVVEEVDTSDASLAEGWKVGVPSSTPLSGAAMHAHSLSLLFGTALYRSELATDTPKAVAPLFGENPGIVAVAAPPCAMPAK